VRADLWREQLRRFGGRSDLSEAQRAFVRDTLAGLTPALYEQPAAQRHETAQRLQKHIAPLFTSKDHRRAWFEIGALGSVEPQSAPSLLSRLTGSFFASAHVPQCDCAGNDECTSGNCTHNACTLQDACGPAGRDTCWGLCS